MHNTRSKRKRKLAYDRQYRKQQRKSETVRQDEATYQRLNNAKKKFENFRKNDKIEAMKNTAARLKREIAEMKTRITELEEERDELAKVVLFFTSQNCSEDEEDEDDSSKPEWGIGARLAFARETPKRFRNRTGVTEEQFNEIFEKFDKVAPTITNRG